MAGGMDYTRWCAVRILIDICN